MNVKLLVKAVMVKFARLHAGYQAPAPYGIDNCGGKVSFAASQFELGAARMRGCAGRFHW